MLKVKMGVLDHVSEMFDCSHGHKIKKRRQLQVTPTTFFRVLILDLDF